MRRTLITYVEPRVREDPLAMMLGIAYLGGALERDGLPVELADERILSEQEVRAAIDRSEIVGFGALTPNARRAIDRAGYARERGKITVMGGPHASADPGLFLDCGHFDYVLRGEAEETLPRLVRALEGGDEAELAGIPGLVARRGGERWIDNPAPPLFKRLDELPLPARHLLPMESYYRLDPRRLAYVLTTRGCPFRCVFCQKELSGRGFRVRSTPLIVDELELLMRDYRPGVVRFVDEILTWGRKRIHELCDEILRRGLKLEWMASTRPDCVDYPLLRHMHRAGCRRIDYGWESGGRRAPDALEPDPTAEGIIHSARLTRRAGIRAEVRLLVGRPGETPEDIAETERVLRRVGPDRVRVSLFDPRVGAGSWRDCQDCVDAPGTPEGDASGEPAARPREHRGEVELAELRESMVRSYERWYFGAGQRARRVFERILYTLENPTRAGRRRGRVRGRKARPRRSADPVAGDGSRR